MANENYEVNGAAVENEDSVDKSAVSVPDIVGSVAILGLAGYGAFKLGKAGLGKAKEFITNVKEKSAAKKAEKDSKESATMDEGSEKKSEDKKK